MSSAVVILDSFMISIGKSLVRCREQQGANSIVHHLDHEMTIHFDYSQVHNKPGVKLNGGGASRLLKTY